MILNIGDRVKSYDFLIGDTILNENAYVIGDIVDIAPVDWCGDNCDHYHIKVLERFDLNGESLSVLSGMVFPPVDESVVILSDWPHDVLDQIIHLILFSHPFPCPF